MGGFFPKKKLLMRRQNLCLEVVLNRRTNDQVDYVKVWEEFHK